MLRAAMVVSASGRPTRAPDAMTTSCSERIVKSLSFLQVKILPQEEVS
jgi:hypothetical protein